MLLHSREGSGERTEINVNAMVEEALNLAYHGARAEKPGFNVTIVRELDPDAGHADLYPQEITRVLLELDFQWLLRDHEAWAGGERAGLRADADRLDPQSRRPRGNCDQRQWSRHPRQGQRRRCSIRSSRRSRPAKGTGLGLSLSHDIVVKQHGGAIDVETAPGSTKFIIRLPRADPGADLKPGGIH